jgi:DegT/DnrJ/EryC1/StrS aminotransferase family
LRSRLGTIGNNRAACSRVPRASSRNEAHQRAAEFGAKCWAAPAGPDLVAFERETAQVCCVTQAVALSSGTSALHLALHHAPNVGHQAAKGRYGSWRRFFNCRGMRFGQCPDGWGVVMVMMDWSDQLCQSVGDAVQVAADVVRALARYQRIPASHPRGGSRSRSLRKVKDGSRTSSPLPIPRA